MMTPGRKSGETNAGNDSAILWRNRDAMLLLLLLLLRQSESLLLIWRRVVMMMMLMRLRCCFQRDVIHQSPFYTGRSAGGIDGGSGGGSWRRNTRDR